MKIEPAVAGFLAAEELGEVMLMRYGRLRDPDGAAEWDYVPHIRFDGLGGFAHMLRTYEGYDLGRPAGREMAAPPLKTRIKAVRAALQREIQGAKRPAVPWKRFDRSVVAGIPKAVGWAVFSEEETKRVAARNRASMNSRLLWALDRAVSPLLERSHPTRLWLMPVNMRGSTRGDGSMTNPVSAIPVQFEEGCPPERVHAAVKEMFESGAHWGSYDLGRLRGKLGEKAIRSAFRAYYARPRFSWMGTFSNLGDSSVPGRMGKYIWIGVPPCTVIHPISAAVMGWGGRLTLTLQAHAAIVDDSEVAPEAAMGWANEWKRLALEASG